MSLKDLFSIVKDYVGAPIVYASGLIFLTLLVLSRIDQYSWVAKYALLNLLTH